MLTETLALAVSGFFSPFFRALTLRRKAYRAEEATLFIMPHCEAALYNAVLSANWADSLSGVAILGNAFSHYRDCAAERARELTLVLESCRSLRVTEFPLTPLGDHPISAFNNLALHLFVDG